MKNKEMTQNEEIIDSASDLNMNTDENAAGTNHLNEPVAEENAIEKLEAALEEQN